MTQKLQLEQKLACLSFQIAPVGNSTILWQFLRELLQLNRYLLMIFIWVVTKVASGDPPFSMLASHTHQAVSYATAQH